MRTRRALCKGRNASSRGNGFSPTQLSCACCSHHFFRSVLHRFSHHKIHSRLLQNFTPGLNISFERPTYRLSAGYNFTAELFARQTQENHAFDRQNFFLDTMWRVDPQLTLSLTDTFIFSTDTNLVSSSQVSSGRDRSSSNVLGAGAGYVLDQFWTLRAGGSWTLERFSNPRAEDSDVYRATVGADRRLTPTLTGGVSYEFGYFDIQREPNVTTHTPRLGARWKATDTISVALSGGPIVEVFENDGSPLSGIFKNLKRLMAAEYSREPTVQHYSVHLSP